LSQQNGLFVLSANDQVLVHKKMVSLKSGDIDRKRLIGRRADGSQFHAEVTFSRCEEAGAAIVQLVVRDISERIFYEEAIRESESRFKALSEVTLEGVVFAQDRIIRDCNPQMAELFGFNSPDDIIGRSIMDFVNEADLIRLEQTVDLRALNKTEIITRAKSGQLLVMDVSCSYIEYRNQRMKVFMFYDVTSRKRAEKALEQSTERYKSLVEHSPNGIFILTEGLIKYVNYSGVQLMGAEDEDEIYETEFLSFFNREDQLKLTSDLLRTREGEEVSYKEYRIISRDGSEVFVGFKPTLTVYEGLPSIQVNMNNLSVRMQLMQETMRAEIAEEINMVLKREIEEHKRTQEKLRAAENFTRNIIQSSIDMIIAVDDCNRITEFNHAAQVQFGYTSGEVMGKELSMLYKNPDDAARVIKEIKENQSFSGEIENITHSGRVFTSLLSASIIRNESGQVFGSMGVSRDITELKKAEKELRASEERYRDLFENATDFIFSIGEEGNFKYANKAFCQKLGVNQQQISNLNIAQILPEVKGLNLFEWFGEQERELTFLSLEGEEIQVFGSTTIRSKANKADSIRAIFRDITTLRKTEKTAKQQGAKLESIFNSSENLMIFTLNRKGVLTSSNKHVHNWLKNNLSRKYKTGESFFDLLQDIIDHNLYHFNPSVFTEVFKGETNQLEIPVKTAQGETEWVEFFMNPVRVQDEIEEISCLVFDITDRKSMDRKILASLKEKEVLLQEVHHRVKNNLQVISSILNLQSSFVDDERILGILEESQSRIKTMSFIHETLYQTADFSSIDFAEYLNTLAKNLVQSYSKGDCAIELVTELKQINLNLDQAIPCGLIVNELVSNALKHAFKGRSNGNITLGISEVNHRVELKIADDGIGLPADFNPKESDSLGIYLVYALIEQLDAAIDVKSLNGTTFLITFDKQ
ncbi:MAG: hypothetical protein RL226_978, partial [Bacteroidota bacterium]